MPWKALAVVLSVGVAYTLGYVTAPNPGIAPVVDTGWQEKALDWETKRDVEREKLFSCEERAARLAGQVAFVERWIMAARKMRDSYEEVEK